MIYLGQTDDFASQYGWVNLDELSEEEFEKERQAYFDELNQDYSYGQEAYEKLMQLEEISRYLIECGVPQSRIIEAVRHSPHLDDLYITKDYRNNGNTEAFKRYESKNTLIHIGNDENKQYIFSLSTYYGLTEIHDFDENFNNNHKTWLTTKFLGINDEHRYIFSYQYSLFKGYSNNYYAVYVQYEGTDNNNKDYSISYTITNFKFSSFGSYEKLTKEFFDNYDNRIVSAFVMTQYSKLVVFFLKSGPACYHLRTQNR